LVVYHPPLLEFFSANKCIIYTRKLLKNWFIFIYLNPFHNPGYDTVYATPINYYYNSGQRIIPLPFQSILHGNYLKFPRLFRLNKLAYLVKWIIRHNIKCRRFNNPIHAYNIIGFIDAFLTVACA